MYQPQGLRSVIRIDKKLWYNLQFCVIFIRTCKIFFVNVLTESIPLPGNAFLKKNVSLEMNVISDRVTNLNSRVSPTAVFFVIIVFSKTANLRKM